MKTIVWLVLLGAVPVLAQKVEDKVRDGGSPITIEAKRIENRIKRELKSKLTFYVERMDPDFIHNDVQPMYKDMLARNLEKAILDSEWDTKGPCYEQVEVTLIDGTKFIDKKRVPASAPERKPGGIICMDAQMIAEMKMGEMIRLIELAFHEHGHNFGYGEDDSNALAAEVGDTFDEEEMTNLKYIPIPKYVPSFMRKLKDGSFCLLTTEVEVSLVFPGVAWTGVIGYGGTTLVNSNSYLQKDEPQPHILKTHVSAKDPLGYSVLAWSWRKNPATKEPVTLIIQDSVTKLRWVQKFAQEDDVGYMSIPLDGKCGD